MSKKEEARTWVVYMESAKRECLGVWFWLGRVKGHVCPEDRAEKQLLLKWPEKFLLEGEGKSYETGITESWLEVLGRRCLYLER